jgi:hypothetical protein
MSKPDGLFLGTWLLIRVCICVRFNLVLILMNFSFDNNMVKTE